MENKVKIIISQLGSPASLKIKDIRSYLREFLGNPRVVDLPRIFWNIILYCFILPLRPYKSRKAYARIYTEEGFPLILNTNSFSKKLQLYMGDEYQIEAAYALSEPRLKKVLEIDEGNTFVMPQFPQYSETTIAVDEDIVEVFNRDNTKTVKVISPYYNLKAFIDLSADKINEKIENEGLEYFVLSFHGIPERRVHQGDIYYYHCMATFNLLKEKIKLKKNNIYMTFQSRLGSEVWLGPYTDEYCRGLAKSGIKKLGIYSPSFVCDCLETTDEIGNELKEDLEKLGCKLFLVDCLNDDDVWVAAYGEYLKAITGSSDKLVKLFYDVDIKKVKKEAPMLKTKDSTLTPKAKKTIKVVFLTLFLDLVGFSIIFPMFPALAKHYLEVDPENYFLNLIFGSIDKFTQLGSANMSAIVLFGGALGALYSLLQFFAAPLWGGLSDKYGRKPILLITIFGLFLSYVLWFFSDSFTLLIIARLVGGIMGGNLSVATATVADVTDETNRSKGMAFVGIAFAFGFIFGPALGGILTVFNPLDHFPTLKEYGVNPFSYAALLAATLSLINLISLYRNFEETIDTTKKQVSLRSANILKLIKPLPYKNVNLTNYAYFLFISAFSGMEFTLTFLAVERLGYSSLDNAYMFIYIGFWLAMVQGGYVRRRANQVGEKKMAMQGLIFLIPGLIIISQANSSLSLYAGLFFLSCGSAMTIPTLTSLVSLYTPKEEQGRSLGIFRSLGSLGRVIGPIAASVIYWKLGTQWPYLLGAAFLLIPILVLTRIGKKVE